MGSSGASSGAGGPAIVVKRAIVTSGDITPPADGAVWNIWGAAPSLSIPAVAGNYVSFEATDFMYGAPAGGTFLDWGVTVGGSVVRYMATDTNTPAIEGSPAFYPNPTSFRDYGPVFEFVVGAGDLSGGTVTVQWIHMGAGTGTLFASTNYPYRWRAVNYGSISVS